MTQSGPNPIPDLGPCRAEFAYNASNFTKVAIFCALAMAGGVAMALIGLFGLPQPQNPKPDAVPRGTITAVLCGLGALLLLGAAGYLWWESRWRDMRLQIYEDGLAYWAGGKAEACRWQDIEEVVWTHRDANGVAAYRLKHGAGPDLVFNSVYFKREDILRLGKVLREKMKHGQCGATWTEFA
jgi:hypothetical protein